MSTTIGKTDVANGVPIIVAAKTLEYLKANTVMTQLVRRDFDNDVAQYGDTVRINKITGLIVGDKGEDSQFSTQSVPDSKIEVTLNKHKYISFLIDDIAKFLAKPNYQADLMNEGVAVLAEQIESDLLALYSNVTTNLIGSAGTDLDADDIIDAGKKLNDSKAPLANRAVVISTKDHAALLKLEKFTSSNWISDNQSALKDASIGRKYGFDIFMSQGVKTTGTSPVSTKNLAFNKGAFVMVSRPLAAPGPQYGVVSKVLSADGIGLRVMTSYSHKDGGYLTTIDLLYGVKTIREALACQLIS